MVATGGNRSQIARPKNGPDQAKTVATGCNRSPFGAHGKEGVDGSSPSECLLKVPANRHFVVVRTSNARTHSGHICGTRGRTAASSDTCVRNGIEDSTRETPCYYAAFRCLDGRDSDRFSAERVSWTPPLLRSTVECDDRPGISAPFQIRNSRRRTGVETLVRRTTGSLRNDEELVRRDELLVTDFGDRCRR